MSADAGRFSIPIRVYYEDTDASGVVYHANYLRYFERARSEWLSSQDLDHRRLMDDVQLAFTVSALEIAFIQPARLGDRLLATVSVTEVRRASLRFAQVLHRPERPDRPLATATVRAAAVDVRSFRPVALPPALIQNIKEMVKTS